MTNELPRILQETLLLTEKQLIGCQKNQTTGLLPFSHSTLWRRVKDGTFPPPQKLSEASRSIAWRTKDVLDWYANPAAYRAAQIH